LEPKPSTPRTKPKCKEVILETMILVSMELVK